MNNTTVTIYEFSDRIKYDYDNGELLFHGDDTGFINSIDQGKIPTGEGVNDALLSTDFEEITGNITLIQNEYHKGDRLYASFDLIKPYCPNNNNDCEWRLEFP